MPRNRGSILTLTVCLAFLAAVAHAQERKIEIVNLQAGQQASGTVEIQAKAAGFQPKVVYVGFTGGPYVQAGTADGLWTAKLDTTLVPNGEQELVALTDDKKVKTAVSVNTKNPFRIYFADLHSHTSYSDGTLLPCVAHDYARNVAKLDVFCLTDHLEKVDDAEWLNTRQVAFAANEDGKFAVIPGLEWTKKWGHLNIYDPKTRVWPTDPAEFYKAAADAGVVTKFNHPGDGTKSHGGLEYSEIGDKTVQLMEVRRDEEQKAFIRALDMGWHISPEGSDDTHSPNWGNVRSWTGMLMPGLSKRNVLDALANRRVYSTLDRNCVLLFKVNGQPMGTIIQEPVSSVEIEVILDENETDDLNARIELFQDGVVVQTDEPNATNRQWETKCTPGPGKHYYIVKVTQADGNLLWSAPVWVTVE